MPPNRVKESTAKEVWYKAGGRCAFSHKMELALDGSAGLIGELAHIIGRGTKGPRANIRFPRDKVNSQANLLLLCPTHHSEVDTNAHEWPTSRLQRMKQRHEAWVRDRLEWLDPSSAHGYDKYLIVLWGPSSAGKDVILNRLQEQFRSTHNIANLQRFTTRKRRPEEALSSPFKHVSANRFDSLVKSGVVSCVHSANDNHYGFDTHFDRTAPLGTLLFTCMRQFRFLPELKVRASAAGLYVCNILIEADQETLNDRILLRATTPEEKNSRILSLKSDVQMMKLYKRKRRFDFVAGNSDEDSIRSCVTSVFSHIEKKVLS